MAQPVTLVTGASRGIGRSVADTLARQGHRIVGLARGKPAADFPGEFHSVDLSDLDATKNSMDVIAAKHAIDHLVHNAGIMIKAPLEETTLADLDAMLTVNLRSAVVLTQAVLPAMKQKKRGRIVMIGSRAAIGKAGSGAYAASKAALPGFVRSWALELSSHNITVNCIAPGPIKTDLVRLESPAVQAVLAAVPLGRIGQPEEVAAACAYFLQDTAGFTTGQILYVDGGITVGLSQV